MLKIALCDDEINQLKIISSIIDKVLIPLDKEYKTFEFKNGEELLLSQSRFDIYFLDIKMDKLTGIETAKKIRLINNDAIIIFITGIKDYVFDAFDVRAFHYILKPVEEVKLRKILISVLDYFEENDKFIIAKTIKKSTRIFVKDIMYIESQLRKLKIHTTYDIIEYYYKLSDIENELSGYNFFRCHRSYIVNLKYVQSYENTSITLKNSEKIYISKYKLSDFSKAFMYYLKNEV